MFFDLSVDAMQAAENVFQDFFERLELVGKREELVQVEGNLQKLRTFPV
jgi:hypothetical protein